MDTLLDFFRNKRVLLTGHTGFKGSWLCETLLLAGAEVCGYALPPEAGGLFEQLRLAERIRSVEGDIRDLPRLRETMDSFAPEIVFHLAAQPIVRVGYADPVGTYSTNVMGTVHLLECVRESRSVRSVLNVTTDKVYQNREWVWGYRESERLDGDDPYANSKSCSELVTSCYDRSFLHVHGIAVSTARAGNAIGGGDFSLDRIIPDCVRAFSRGEPVILRCPSAVRPYQHVLELLAAYLLIVKAHSQNILLAGSYNAGPAVEDCVTTKRLAELFCRFWGPEASWQSSRNDGPAEANLLLLDSSKIRSVLGWRPVWSLERGVQETVRWYQTACKGRVQAITDEQIRAFFASREEQCG